jgi:hypothetical protein
MHRFRLLESASRTLRLLDCSGKICFRFDMEVVATFDADVFRNSTSVVVAE